MGYAPKIVAHRVCTCGVIYGITRVQSIAPHPSYCSRACFYKNRRPRPSGLKYNYAKPNPIWEKLKGRSFGTPFPKGHKPANAGRLTSASYWSIHHWVRNNFEHKSTCEHCEQPKKLDWANASGEYTLEREDWLSLCRSCHSKYDKAHPAEGGLRAKFTELSK